MTTKLKISLLAFVAILFFQTNAFAQWNDTGNPIWTDQAVGIGYSSLASGYRLTVVASTGKNGIYAAAFGNKTGIRGSSNTGIGIYGRETAGGKAIYGHALSASGYAGYFSGRTFISGNTQIGAGSENSLAQLQVNGQSFFTGNINILSSAKQAILKCGAPEGEGPYMHLYGLDYAGTTEQKGRIAFVAGGNAESKGEIAFVNKEASGEYYQIMTVLGDQKKVGIGTTNVPSGYKLAVTDGIITEKVKVQLKAEWADYVFDENYERTSIEDVENHVKEKKHLPNVPSAKTVKENGIDVAEMDATLLRQIEELWLHVIDLNKKVKELEEENTSLKESKNK